jgi:hypothetical protein
MQKTAIGSITEEGDWQWQEWKAGYRRQKRPWTGHEAGRGSSPLERGSSCFRNQDVAATTNQAKQDHHKKTSKRTKKKRHIQRRFEVMRGHGTTTKKSLRKQQIMKLTQLLKRYSLAFYSWTTW